MTLATKLKRLREKHILTQEDLAAKLRGRYRTSDISRYQIANWETGRDMPTWPRAKLLVRYFRITLDDLFFDDRTEFLHGHHDKKVLKRA